MKKSSLLEASEGIEDTRRNLSVQYPLHEVPLMLPAVVICGATSYVKVKTFAKSQEECSRLFVQKMVIQIGTKLRCIILQRSIQRKFF